MYLYQITITDKNKPEYAECPDEFTYNVAAESLPDAVKKLWLTHDFNENFDPDCDAVVIRCMGEIIV